MIVPYGCGIPTAYFYVKIQKEGTALPEGSESGLGPL